MNRYIQLPIHRIMKIRHVPEAAKTVGQKAADLYMNGVRLLDDPATGRKLILIGTTNSSTLLAQRTKQIIEDAKPDKVLVESDPTWFQFLNSLDSSTMKTNAAVQNAAPSFPSLGHLENIPRNLYFKMRFYLWLAAANLIFPLHDEHSNWFKPGLEAFNAAKWAHDNKKQVIFSGTIFNDSVMTALRNEQRLHILPFIYRSLFGKNSSWDDEFFGYYKQIAVHGLAAWAENLTDEKLSWTIKLYEKVVPEQAKIMVEHEDERLFNLIFREMTGKVNVAVVNAWHLQGIEAYWRHTTGTLVQEEFINPIGDMDLNAIAQTSLINEYLRRNKAGKSKTEPAVTSSYLWQYNKQNTEAERERHVFFLGHDDPELEHGLYNNENKHVKDLPYKIKHH